LPTKERDVAFKLLKRTGVKIPNVPVNQHQIGDENYQEFTKGDWKDIQVFGD